MVNLMRTNQRWLMIVISVLVLVSFIWFYSDRTHSDGLGTDRVGKIYGRSLTVTELQRTERQLRIAEELGLIHLTQREIFEGGDMNAAAINDLVIQHEAERMNLYPTDDEVADAELKMAAFQGSNGEFDPAKKDEVMTDRLTPNGFSANQLDDLVRQDLQVAKLREIVDAPVVVSPLEVRRYFERGYVKTDASVIRLQKADFTAAVPEPTADEIKKYYDEQKDRFTQPERRKVQYVKFGLDDAQKKLAGKERMDALKPLADQAVQFLEQLLEQKGGAGAGLKPGDKDAAGSAEQKARENFAAAAAAARLTAKETSEFEETQAPSGEEGAIPGFAPAAFKLSKSSPDSDVPLQTTDAFYDLHLSGLVPERPLTLDEARPKIAAAIKDERATAAVAAKAEEIRNKIVDALKAGHPWAEAAKAAGQTPQDAPAFSLAEPARALPDASAVAGAAQELGTGELSKFVPTGTGGLLVFVLGRQGIDEAKFAKDKEMVATNLRRQKASYFFYEWLRASRDAAGAEISSRLRG